MQAGGPPPPWDALEESLGVLKGVRDGDKLDIYDPDAGGVRVATQDYFTSMRRWALGWGTHPEQPRFRAWLTGHLAGPNADRMPSPKDAVFKQTTPAE